MANNEELHNLFQPTFGNRPEQYIGRDGVINQFMEGLQEPVGSRNRCTLFLGQRGMGKTALLLELGDRAAKAGYVVARVTAHEGMPKAIIEQFQLIRAYYERAFKSVDFKASDKILDRAALATRGFPYLMQLIGYYIIQYAKDGGIVDTTVMDKSEKAAMGDLDDNVFKPILSPLSDNDKILLKAMARQGDTVSVAKLQATLGKKGPAIQPYRKRLLDAGVIEAPRRGELVFAVPYLAEYLRNNQ